MSNFRGNDCYIFHDVLVWLHGATSPYPTSCTQQPQPTPLVVRHKCL